MAEFFEEELSGDLAMPYSELKTLYEQVKDAEWVPVTQPPPKWNTPEVIAASGSVQASIDYLALVEKKKKSAAIQYEWVLAKTEALAAKKGVKKMPCGCSDCQPKSVNIKDLGLSSVRFALCKDPSYSVPLPKKLKGLLHQECGSVLVPAPPDRMACCSCLKTGYLLPAPDTSVGSSDDDDDEEYDDDD